MKLIIIWNLNWRQVNNYKMKAIHTMFATINTNPERVGTGGEFFGNSLRVRAPFSSTNTCRNSSLFLKNCISFSIFELFMSSGQPFTDWNYYSFCLKTGLEEDKYLEERHAIYRKIFLELNKNWSQIQCFAQMKLAKIKELQK